MKSFRNKYPPYVGKDPYIFLCYEAADIKIAELILKRLWQRGCRIWYPLPGSSEVENQGMMEHAGLVLVMNTSQFAASKAKRNMMFLQSKGVPIIVVDCIQGDVISTGESLRALEELMKACGANVVAKAAVLAEDKAADRDDIIFLEKLPLFNAKTGEIL